MLNEIRRGQIYFADMPARYGSEQGGFRPVLIIQNDVGNRYSPTTLVAPLTSSKTKRNLPTHVVLNGDRHNLNNDSTVLLEQVSVIDKSRLKGYVTYLDDSKMREINTALSVSFGIMAA